MQVCGDKANLTIASIVTGFPLALQTSPLRARWATRNKFRGE